MITRSFQLLHSFIEFYLSFQETCFFNPYVPLCILILMYLKNYDTVDIFMTLLLKVGYYVLKLQ